MKKFLMMVAVIVMTAASVNAQNKVEDLRHEIGVTYGLGASLVGDGIGNGLSNGIFDSPERAKFGLTEPQMLEAARLCVIHRRVKMWKTLT